MGKFFTEENAQGDHKPKPQPKKKSYFTDANKGEVQEERPTEPAKQPEWWEGPAKFGMDALRNFNDTITFGGYPALLEMTGLDPNADEALEASDPWAAIAGDTLGYMIPGSIASKAVGTAIKPLARNTIPAIVGREGLASGLVSATDDVARGEFSPTDIALDTALGGVGGGVLSGLLAATGRGISTGARVRGMGSELSDADRAAAKAFSDYANDYGITLNNAEAVSAVAPSKSQSVEQGFNRVASAPQGNATLASFNASRGKGVEEAGRSIIERMGGGVSPRQASQAAEAAIARNEELVRNTALPYYTEAEFLPSGDLRKMPPSWVPKGGYTEEAMRMVADDPGLMKGLTLYSNGQQPGANSIVFLDAAKKEIDAMAANAFAKERGNAAGFMRDEANALTQQMDRVAPTYPIARDITEQGTRMVDDLRAGPLATVAKSGKTGTQGQALFGATNEIEKGAASNAARQMDPGIPTGVLANVIDTAVSKKPLGWGKTALPTPQAKELADEALIRADQDSLLGPLAAARAVDPDLPNPLPHEHTGWSGALYSAIRDLGSGGTAKKLVDPKWIERFGKMGPVQKTATRVGTSAVQASIQGSRNRRRKKKKD